MKYLLAFYDHRPAFFLSAFLIWPLLSSASSLRAFDHSGFDSLLQKHVADGLVNYRALKADLLPLQKYLQQLEQVNPGDFKNWPLEEQMAFWVNAYNAITIEGIVRNYPIQWGSLLARARFPKNSIRQISGFWDAVFIKVMGRELTLNQIEHEILRKQFKDPRIHFVIVCASIGCPDLESRAFVAKDLDQRLDDATRNFITNPGKARLDRKENVLYLSSIFDWYKEDFKASNEAEKQYRNYSKAERGLIEFVIEYVPETDREYIIQNQPKIKYLDYDWSLNEQT
ncbi:DUF547 domain-containing protein [candidate division KSB1 bacterium]|nr:DUF547 domain-containing protein [candidate division KSB1 bacterium]